MTKAASAGFKARLSEEVVPLAPCIKFYRRDGKRFHFTGHDLILPQIDIGDGFGPEDYLANPGMFRTSISASSGLTPDDTDIKTILLDSADAPVSDDVKVLSPLDVDADDDIILATGTLGSQAAIQAVEKQFGAGSVELTPSGSVDPSQAFLSYPDHASYLIEINQFTIEGWVRFKDLTSTIQTFASQYLNTGDQRSWYLRRNAGDLEFVTFQAGTATPTESVVGAFTWAIDTWYHVAVSRDVDQDVRVFVAGNQVGVTTNMPGTLFNSTEVLRLGKIREAGGDDLPLDGFVDDFRLTVGQALYTADFTPPIAALTSVVPSVGAIIEEDLHVGLWDGAEFRLFFVLWDDLTEGIVRMRRGFVGKLQHLDMETTIQARGLLYLYDQKTIIRTSTRCPHFFADPDTCMFIRDPALWAASTAYVVDDKVAPLAAENGKMFLCTVAGTSGGSEPTWDLTVGNTTVDGGVTWETVESTVKFSDVTGVTDHREFQITAPLGVTDEPTFGFGFIVWDTGANSAAGRNKWSLLSWENSGLSVKLRDLVPFTIEVGDKLRLFAGCPKRAEDCKTYKNIINFGGFRFMPGDKAITTVVQ